jgi:hypothetical protein
MRALAILALVLALPCLAQAQANTCVILSQHGSSSAPAEAHDRATAALADDLRARGMTVIPASDAQTRMADQPFRDCAEIDCAAAVNRFLGTRLAVLAELTWLRGRPTMINVVLIGTTDGASTGGQALIERGGDLATAAHTALATAWDRWAADAQGTVVIDTTPTGALVSIDGSPVGRAPVRQLVSPGAHTIAATLDGYDAQTREVTIDRLEEHPLSFVLVETAAPAPVVTAEPRTPPPLRWENRPQFANWLLGFGLIGLGAIFSIEPVWTGVTNGTVYDHGAAGTDTVVFGPWSIAWAIISGACVIAGVVVLLVVPFSDRVAMVMGPTGAQLRGTF